MHMKIIQLDKDSRRNTKNKETVIFAPVGDVQQFKEFAKMMEFIGLTKDKSIDFLFVVREDIKLPEVSLSAIYYKENKVKLGTSGAFFAGQSEAYNLGYEYICVADIDAVLTDKKVLYDLIETAKETQKVALPILQSRQSEEASTATFANGYGVYPRQIFEKHGFCTPFFWKGAEDYDLTARLGDDKIVCKQCLVYHPLQGLSIYHKMANRRKFYPYVRSLMKAFLLLKENTNYILWYNYYIFFADVFDDKDLSYIISHSNRMEVVSQDISTKDNGITIETIKNTGKVSSKFAKIVSELKALFGFVIRKPYYTYTDKITVKSISILNLISAFITIPVNLILSVYDAFTWRDNLKDKFIYPVFPKDVPDAEDWILKRFPRGD